MSTATNDYHVLTRSKNNIASQNVFTMCLTNHYQKMLSIRDKPCSISTERKSILDELDALVCNVAWYLVVDCKWLFQIKMSFGCFVVYKARLIAKGYTDQCWGVDFKKIFATMIKPETIKLILTIALKYKWTMIQLDVNNAFV